MNTLISESNQQWKINDQVDKRIQLITDAVNNALRNATTTSNRILSLKEIISVKDLLTDQGVNITLPDEALQYVIPKIVVNQETLLYILQVPKLEDEESTAIMIVPLVINNTIINSYPQHVIKSKQRLFTSLNHADFVQKHSRIQEFRDNCIKHLIMGTDSQCNVTTELETTIRYISEDKLLVNNAKEGSLSSNCGPNDRTLTGNFLIKFWNCTILFNNRKFYSNEIKSEIQEIQGALHNIRATRKLIENINIETMNQEHIENWKKLAHVYLKQANHKAWIWSLAGGVFVSTTSITILIVYIIIKKNATKISITNSSGADTGSLHSVKTTNMLNILKGWKSKPKTEDALSSPPGGVILHQVTPNNIPTFRSHTFVQQSALQNK